MRPQASVTLNEFFAAVSSAPGSTLLLDYDGTLAPFRLDRYQARPYAGVRELLGRIQASGRTQIAFITGRPAGEIAPMVRLEQPFEVWGLHGAERIHADGRREMEQASPLAVEKLEALRAQLRRDSFGGLFEDKANGAVMHWRGLPPAKARIVEERARRLFGPLAQLDSLRLLDFEAGLELRVGRDKGGAVEAILDESKAKSGARLPVAFLGDDLTDEAGFRAVNASGSPSLSVLMRRDWRKTEANVWLKPPVELREFLERWADAVEG